MVVPATKDIGLVEGVLGMIEEAQSVGVAQSFSGGGATSVAGIGGAIRAQTDVRLEWPSRIPLIRGFDRWWGVAARARRIREIRGAQSGLWSFAGEGPGENIFIDIRHIAWVYHPRVGTLRAIFAERAWLKSYGERRDVGMWSAALGSASMPQSLPRTVILFLQDLEEQARGMVMTLRGRRPFVPLRSWNPHRRDGAHFPRVCEAAQRVVRRHEVEGVSDARAVRAYCDMVLNHEIDHKVREIATDAGRAGEHLADLHAMACGRGAFFALEHFLINLEIDGPAYRALGRELGSPFSASSAAEWADWVLSSGLLDLSREDLAAVASRAHASLVQYHHVDKGWALPPEIKRVGAKWPREEYAP